MSHILQKHGCRRSRNFHRLGCIRRANPVIGTGRQRTVDVHTCVRYDDRDTILIRLLPDAGRPIDVAGTFADGTTVTELYTGRTATVRRGAVAFPAYKNRVAIIRKSE